MRVALPGDLHTVVALRLALLSEHRDNLIYGRMRPDAVTRAHSLFQRQLASTEEVTFLAEDAADRSAVGILRCVESPGSPLLYPSQYGYISSVYVVPATRRTGVLRQLLDAAAAWCADRDLTELRLHNAAENLIANDVWETLGFRTVEVLRVRQLEEPKGARARAVPQRRR